DPAVQRSAQPLVLGDWGVLRRAARRLKRNPRLILWRPNQPLLRLFEQRGAAVVCSLSALSAKDSRPGVGSKPAGHTELLAELSGTAECRLMLIGARLRVVPVTGHIPFTQVARRLTRENIQAT